MTVLLGKTIQDHGLVTECIDPAKQVQVCGIDLTVGKIETYLDRGCIDFDNTRRMLPRLNEPGRIDDFWVLSPGAYLITFNEIVNVPADCCGIARSRSTLLRFGATIETAVWDPGYKGRSQSMLVVHNPNGIKICKNARVLQLIFVKLDKESEVLYSGRYQGEGIQK